MNLSLPRSSKDVGGVVNPSPVEKTRPIRRKRVRWKRNWLCVCGSGLKFKRCCMEDMQDLDLLDNNEQMGE